MKIKLKIEKSLFNTFDNIILNCTKIIYIYTTKNDIQQNFCQQETYLKCCNWYVFLFSFQF